LALALAAPAAALEVPDLDGRVNDRAGMLSASSRRSLESALSAFEARGGVQIAVLTIPSLEGEPLEAFSLKTARAWGLGRKDVNDGVLFLISKNDRRMRIEVGHGLEGSLPDALAGRIIADETAPRFRAGDYDGGITAGVNAIMAASRGSYAPPKHHVTSGEDWGRVMGNVIVSGILYLSVGCIEAMGLISVAAGWLLYVLPAALWAGLPLAYEGSAAVPECLWTLSQMFFIPLVMILLRIAGVTGKFRFSGKSLYYGDTVVLTQMDRSPGGYPGDSGPSSSSSDSGFSGGGGSFGGGGASGSW